VIYYISVYTRNECEEFCKWLLQIKAPVAICVNNGKVYNLTDEGLKLYWLSGFQALVENKV